MTPRPAPRLIAISDSSALDVATLIARFANLAEGARAGTVALLLRDHAASGRARLALGEALVKVAEGTGQQLWVADRLDLALLLGAHGLHLGEQSVRALDARKLVGDELHLSRAFHGACVEDDEAAAELSGVDALLISPVLAPRKGRPALGLSAFKALGEQLRARNWAYPLYALGGVSAANAAACLAAGATGVAAIGAVLDPDVRPLLAALDILREH